MYSLTLGRCEIACRRAFRLSGVESCERGVILSACDVTSIILIKNQPSEDAPRVLTDRSTANGFIIVQSLEDREVGVRDLVAEKEGSSVARIEVVEDVVEIRRRGFLVVG